MEDLSLHILDIAENSVRAQARTVEIRVEEDSVGDRLLVEIKDDGRGMDEATKRRALDPFFTTKSERRVGLGLSLLAQASRAAGGRFTLDSHPGLGTRVEAVFSLGHIDRQPLGDMSQTLLTLILGNPQTDFIFHHTVDGRSYGLDTREIRAGRDGQSLQNPEIIRIIRKNIQEGLASLRRKS